MAISEKMQTNKNKIAFVIPFFGKLPEYSCYFFASIKDKPFDVLIFSDNMQDASMICNNIYWHQMSFENIKALFSKTLEIEIALSVPSKLCDFKPAYGLIFQEYLNGYNYWGVLDIDTIIGDFQNYIAEHFLTEIDFLSGLSGYVSGSFFLARNSTELNLLFKKSKDWKTIFSTRKYLGFDECCGHFFNELSTGSKTIFEINAPYQSFTELVFTEQEKGLKVYCKNLIIEPNGWKSVFATNKNIEYDDTKYLVFHFLHLKKHKSFLLNLRDKSFPLYINNWGTFTHKPSFIHLFLSNRIYIILLDKFRRRVLGK